MKFRELAIIMDTKKEVTVHDREGRRLAKCDMDDVPAFLDEVGVSSVDIMSDGKVDIVVTFTNNLAFIDYIKEHISDLEEALSDDYRVSTMEDVNNIIKDYAAQMENDCGAVAKALGENRAWDCYFK